MEVYPLVMAHIANAASWLGVSTEDALWDFCCARACGAKGLGEEWLYLAFFVEQGGLSRLASQQISQTCFPSVLHFLCSRSEWISCSSEARRFLCRDGYPKGCPGGEIFQRSETQRVAAPVPREQGGGTLPGAGVLVLLFGFACEKIWRLPNIPQILSFMPAFDGLGNCGSFHSYVNVYQRVNPSEV